MAIPITMMTRVIASTGQDDSAAGDAGAFALLPGFTFAAMNAVGQSHVLPAAHL
jgi:hypothetical protein